MFAVYAADGTLVSTGTRLADPLPPHLASRTLTDQEAAWIAAGGRWDADTREAALI
jgi:hypothetical protein